MIVLFGWPRMRAAKLKSDVRSARVVMTGLYGRARAGAVQFNRPTTLVMNGNVVTVTATPRVVPVAGSTTDTISWPQDLNGQYGVTITATSGTITADPRGFGSSGSFTIWVRKAEFLDSVVISGFGRLVQ